jgi:hypothetical protein
MPGTKQDFVRLLALNSGLTEAQAEQAVNALPETCGRFTRDYGATGPGAYNAGYPGGFQFAMTRQQSPAQWSLNITLDAAALADFGDGSDRFGLPVVNQ